METQPQDAVGIIAEIESVLAKPQTLRKRIHEMLRCVANHFDASASTLYLLDNPSVLEVFAFYDPQANDTRRTRFRVGEGIIGAMVVSGESVCTENITTHPNFVYRLGVVDYVHLAMVAVPIRLADGIAGVISIQNPPAKHFSLNHLHELQRIAEVLSALPEVQSLRSHPYPQSGINQEESFKGISLSAGVAFGHAVIHHSRSWRETASSQSTQVEQKRLKKSIRQMIEEIDSLIGSFGPDEEGEHQDILRSYRMIAGDRGWVKSIQSQIQQGLTAEAAVQRVRRHTREKFAEVGDKVLKARLSDLEDLANRILRHLTGESIEEIPEASILVASHMGPAELLDYDRRYVKGLILEEGTHSEHVAIVARALGIPVVGRIPNATLRIRQGELLVIDADHAEVVRQPGPEKLNAVRQSIAKRKKWEVLSEEVRDLPNKTADGFDFHLRMNLGLLVELDHLEKTGAEGVGLYRTEIPFMMRSSFPSTSVQRDLYSDVLARSGGQPVYFRTLDIGGDKVVPYMWQTEDENPAMGWRAIRVGLDRPALLRQQVRAILQAHTTQEARILFPMVTVLGEFLEAKRIAEEERARLRTLGEITPDVIRYGVMLEVPALIAQLPALLREVDFVAVGSNDLFQYSFACDRSNPHLTSRYDVLHPAFLRLLRVIQVECAMADTPLHICGVMAGTPLSALALLGLGYNSFSVDSSSLAEVKKVFVNAKQKELADFMSDHLQATEVSLQKPFMEFCQSQNLL